MNNKPSQCFECETGTYKEVTINYFSQLSEGRSCLTRDGGDRGQGQGGCLQEPPAVAAR